MRLIIFVVWLLLIPVYSFTQEDEEMLRRIYDEQLTNSEAYENLRVLTKEIGPRLEGSSNLVSAIEYTRELMMKYDFDTVYLQAATVTNWKRGAGEKMRVFNSHTKQSRDLNCLALGNSIATGDEGVSGELVELYGMSALRRADREQIEGKIVFLNEPFDKTIINTFEAYNEVSAQREYGTSLASEKGAVGVVIRSLAVSADSFPHTGYMEYKEGINKIPAIAVSACDADFLSEELKKFPDIKVRIVTNCSTRENVLSYNVIGEIRGSRSQENIIVVGGHIDSWDVGEGAHDDAGGCLQAIEVLRTFKALDIHPGNTVRVVLWTGEENSWGGNIEYAKQAKINKEKHIAALESDRGSYTPLGFAIETENPKAYEKVQSWKALFEPYWVNVFQKGSSGVDIKPLKDDSNLLLGLVTDSHKYFSIHHSEKDVYEEVDKRELELCAATMTSIVYLIDKYGIE